MKKLENVTSVEMPVDEKLEIKKMRFTPDGNDSGKRISIVTGIHGDELEDSMSAMRCQSGYRNIRNFSQELWIFTRQ